MQGRDNAQRCGALQRRRLRRNAYFQRLDATFAEIATPQPDCIFAHAKKPQRSVDGSAPNASAARHDLAIRQEPPEPPAGLLSPNGETCRPYRSPPNQEPSRIAKHILRSTGASLPGDRAMGARRRAVIQPHPTRRPVQKGGILLLLRKGSFPRFVEPRAAAPLQSSTAYRNLTPTETFKPRVSDMGSETPIL